MTGNELKPTEIINGAVGPGGPSEIRYRAHVAFSTMTDALKNLEAVHNRRKALVWVSDGYDFARSRTRARHDGPELAVRAERQRAGAESGRVAERRRAGRRSEQRPGRRQQKQSEQFADADLARELYEITQAANRANTTIYTIDPRGLVGPLADLDENVDPQQWSEFVRKSQDSLRTLAEETGGHRGRQHERLHEGAEAHGCRDERLLRAGVLLEEPGHPEAAAVGRSPQSRGRGSSVWRARNTC